MNYSFLRTFCIFLLIFLGSCDFGSDSDTLVACTKTDCNCSDFQTQEEAQIVFDQFEGDPFALDSDGNGLVCQNLPKTPEPNSKVSTNPLMKFGNPSNSSNKDLSNYLLRKSQYIVSYNCSKGIPNWVAWHLNKTWIGSVKRSDDFRSDPTLPEGCVTVKPNDYRGSGFDKGHITPSADRTNTQENNSATFLMTNMIPQAPANNREVWRELEEYSRDLVFEGKELYIIAGGERTQSTIGNGKISVPMSTWKIIVVLDSPRQTIDENTRIIAVNIPNDQSVAQTDWEDYIVSVDAIENVTGFDFFSDISQKIERKIEEKTD